MKKYQVLKNNYEFKRAYTKGRFHASLLVVTYCFKRKSGGVKVGITTSKKIGNSPTRNRARRVIRAAAADLIPQIKGNYDVVFVARSDTAGSKSYAVGADIKAQLMKLGVLR
jgi:ribonuclease P protein component